MRSARLFMAMAFTAAAWLTAAQAHDLALNVSQPVYRPGDVIDVTAHVTNTKGQPTNLSLDVLLRDQRSKVAPTLVSHDLSLAGGESKSIQLFLLPVDQRYYSGPYVVQASLIEGRFVVCQAEATFQIEGAPEDMAFEIILSRDPSASKRASVFIKNEKVYLAYDCDVQGPAISAWLNLPDGSKRQITLPCNVTAKQAGSYSIQLNVSKDGYRPLTIVKYFAVLEQDPVLLQSQREASNLSLAIARDQIQQGQMVELHGFVLPAHADANVTLSYVKQGITSAERTVATDDDGRFSDSFRPPEPGDWVVWASWNGDSNHLGGKSNEIRFTVQPSILEGKLIWAIIGILAILLVAVAVGGLRRQRR